MTQMGGPLSAFALTGLSLCHSTVVFLMTLQSQAEFRAAQISLGRYDMIVGNYLFPLCVVYRRARSLTHTQRDLWAFFQSLHSSVVMRGYARLCANVTAHEIPHRSRFRVWTDWVGHRADGSTGLVAQTICYCRGSDAAHQIEMIEFTHLALPDIAALLG